MNYNVIKTNLKICYAYFPITSHRLVIMHNLLGHVFIIVPCPFRTNYGADYFFDRFNSLHYVIRIKIYQTVQLCNCTLFNIRNSYEA